jgi:YbgC/YbaW family acyl-CoA thioester hydrolase
MAHEFKVQRMVEFVETDMAGILHFSNFFRYMEAAEHGFFRSLGLSVHPHSATGVWGWARGNAECKYLEPLRYEDQVEIHLLVREKRRTSISYEIIFRKQSREVARGNMTVICVAKAAGGDRIRAITIPDDVAAGIDVAPNQD